MGQNDGNMMGTRWEHDGNMMGKCWDHDDPGFFFNEKIADKP